MLYDIYEKGGSGCPFLSPMKSDAVHRFLQYELLQSATKSKI